VGGSAVLLVTSNLANALHFAFHLVMARMLGPEQYGMLAAVFAVLFVLGVVAEAGQTVVARQAALAPSPAHLHSILVRALRQLARLGAGLLAAFLLVSLVLAPLLRVPYSLLAVFAPAVLAVALLPVPRGALLGLRRFVAFGGNLLVEPIVKLACAVGAVAAGLGVHGATGAVSVSLLACLGAGLLPLRDALRAPAAPVPAPEERGYALPVLLTTGTVMAFYSLDVMIARALFPAEEAGQYALASLLGKGIVLGTLPLARAMFPLASRAASPREARRVLAGALGLLALCLTPALLAVALLPRELARLAGGPGYEGTAAILLSVAGGLSLMAVSQTLVFFRLAAGPPRFAGWIAASLAGEVALLVACSGSLATFALGVLAAHLGFVAVAAAFLLAPARATPGPPGTPS
jgi:O-antigen/teichoic acid export membrane protein